MSIVFKIAVRWNVNDSYKGDDDGTDLDIIYATKMNTEEDRNSIDAYYLKPCFDDDAFFDMVPISKPMASWLTSLGAGRHGYGERRDCGYIAPVSMAKEDGDDDDDDSYDFAPAA
ncbi:hypothetical protein SDJN03_09196, partial [Cucurbita argyrosperma subsp. sororia]